MPDIFGTIVDNRYHILEEVGRGGMAKVYKVHDIRLKRVVALKIMDKNEFSVTELQEYLVRFQREAKVLSGLQHPYIMPISDYGEHEGAPFIVMEYMPKGTLHQKLLHPMPWQDATKILLPVMRALTIAHKQKIIHRDIKPSNILLRESGELVLSDFGVAKSLTEAKDTFKTKTGVIIGTPDYMAPEQGQGLPVDARADVYAMGVVLYEMVTGRRPYDSTPENPMQVLFDKVQKSVPNPRKFVYELPVHVSKIIIKALARDPEKRYQTMNAFVSSLEKVLAVNEKQDGKKTGRTTLQVTIRNNRTQISIALIGLIGTIIGAVLLSPILGKYQINIPTAPQTTIVTLTQPALVPTATTTQISVLPITKRPTPSTPYPAKMIVPPDMAMILVPAGNFTEGRNDGAADEGAAHRVYLDDFYISEYEVTNANYRLCVDASICKPPKENTSATRANYSENPKFDNFPVIYVDWNMAKTYCEWHGARLATEAEWEKAARGADGNAYPWGEELNCEFANYCEEDTVAVRDYKNGQSPYGVFNMAGNISEWVADWYQSDYYSTLLENVINPLGPESGIVRVVRGGSWSTNDNDVRTTNRNGFSPSTATDYIGFRCAYTP